MITFDTVQEIGLSMPGVEKGLAYGVPALKVQGQLLACVPANPSAEPGSLLVRVVIRQPKRASQKTKRR